MSDSLNGVPTILWGADNKTLYLVYPDKGQIYIYDIPEEGGWMDRVQKATLREVL